MSEPAGQVPAGGPKRRQGSPRQGAEDNPGWAIFGYLLSGMAVYGGIGWLVGGWVGNRELCLAVGALAGLALAITLVILRYGRS